MVRDVATFERRRTPGLSMLASRLADDLQALPA